MRISSFEYHDEKQPGWNYAKILFHSINLFVGETGSGKTRLLNTIFNIGVFVTQGSVFMGGKWEISFEGDDANYRWKFEGRINEDGKGVVLVEELVEIRENKEDKIIIQRNGGFRFNDVLLPKLASDMCSIFLLKEEEVIAPIYQVFSRIMRRSFSDVGLSQPLVYANVPLELEKELAKKKSLELMSKYELTVSLKLFFLEKYFNPKYKELCSFYESIFPVIEHCKITEASSVAVKVPLSGRIPVFAIKEKHVNQLIHLQELSAGMQKVLLIMTDIIALPQNSLYLIDEYENSLGINAIDFLPSFLADQVATNSLLSPHITHIL
jgi:energy-coupling factor transporter ATP-binding protein EcfA2